jgi:uncharacterized protein YbaR (Trm112 family)
MDRIFWVECPSCRTKFSVDYGIRFVDVDLECPKCRNKFPVAEAASVDERW